MNAATYWYKDKEMNLILLQTMANYLNRAKNGAPVYLKGPCDNLSPYGLTHILDDHANKEGIVIIPMNFDSAHWVGLVLVFSRDLLITAEYYDSTAAGVPEFLNSILREKRLGVEFFTAINDERLIRQSNGSDCGPCTIENLIAAVGYREDRETTPLTRRGRHLALLKLTEPESYAEFTLDVVPDDAEKAGVCIVTDATPVASSTPEAPSTPKNKRPRFDGTDKKTPPAIDRAVTSPTSIITSPDRPLCRVARSSLFARITLLKETEDEIAASDLGVGKKRART